METVKNPMEAMIEGAVKEAIRDVVREEIALALKPFTDLLEAAQSSKNLMVKALLRTNGG